MRSQNQALGTLALALITLSACAGESDFSASSAKNKKKPGTALGPRSETPSSGEQTKAVPGKDKGALDESSTVTLEDGRKDATFEKGSGSQNPLEDNGHISAETSSFTENKAFADIEPAVAVNKPACIACHASISGSFITDFGAKLRPFKDRNAGFEIDANGKPLKTSVVQDADSLRPLAFRAMNLDGDFVVPNIKIDGGDILTSFKKSGFASDAIPLVDALAAPQVVVDGPWSWEAPDVKSIALPVVGTSRDKSKPGVNSIRSATDVVIAPPNESEIRALEVRVTSSVLVDGDLKVGTLSEDSAVAGLGVRRGRTGPYATNTGGITCKGDILVIGTLLLNEVGDLIVSGKSCRIYVSGSIFVRGPISATGGVLQLAAGRAMSIGIKDSRMVTGSPEVLAERDNVYDALEDSGVAFVMRMKGDSGRVVATTAFLWNGATPNHPAPATVAEVEAAKLSYANYNDAKIWTRVGSENPSPEGCTFDIGDGRPVNPNANCEFYSHGIETAYGKHREVLYSGVLFAAPEVHGRYHGKITGVIVAQLAIFALSDFQFKADARFKDVPILPALGRKILELK